MPEVQGHPEQCPRRYPKPTTRTRSACTGTTGFPQSQRRLNARPLSKTNHAREEETMPRCAATKKKTQRSSCLRYKGILSHVPALILPHEQYLPAPALRVSPVKTLHEQIHFRPSSIATASAWAVGGGTPDHRLVCLLMASIFPSTVCLVIFRVNKPSGQRGGRGVGGGGYLRGA